MRKKSTVKKIAAMLLVVVLVAMLFPATITAKAETPSVKPFYLVNWDRNIETNKFSNVYYMPYTWINGANFDANSTEINIGVYVNGASSSNVKTAAQLVYNDFSIRPEGTRYLNLAALGTVFNKCVKDAIDFEDGIRLVSDWVDRFLTEYKALGGVMDGFAIDLEYNYYTSFYIQSYFCSPYTENGVEKEPRNIDILQDIVRNERVYQAKIRPQLKELEAQGLFTFYTGGSGKDTSTGQSITITIDPATGLPTNPYAAKNGTSKLPIPVSEITTINRYDNDGGNATSRGTWGTVLQRHIVNCIDRAAFEPLIKHFPDATLSDYSHSDVYSWDKGFSTGGESTGSGAKAGNTSNGVYYGSAMSEYFYSSGSGSATRQLYYKPVGQDSAVYEPDTAYATFEREINNNKRLVAEADRSGDKVSIWIPYYHYSSATKSYGNTAYYSELVYHLGLSNPEPFLGYLIQSEVVSKGKTSTYSHDPKYGDFQYTLGITNELLAELTRVAGASDRKALVTPIEWDDDFMLSGMYAGGRNIWRLTPDTTKISVADFKVKDKAPTFTVNGVTITFPQGRIIEDASITDIGSAGYWIETPADVEPVITRSSNYLNDNPAFAENWEGYNPGEFTSIKGSLDLTQYSSAYRPDTYWTKSGAGTATIVESNGNKAMTLTGTTTLTNGSGKASDYPSLTVPSKITAGDYFAKQQTWEVTVTMPSSFSGTIQLLNYTGTDGFKITNTGKVQYPYIYSSGSSGYFTNMSLTLTAGKTYTFKRVLDFAAKTCSYYVYDASGSLLKSQTSKRIISVSTVSTIGISTSNVSGTVTIDNYKLIASGLTTNLDLYEEIPLNYFEGYTGYVRKVSDTTADRTTPTTYRVSWMNNSGAYKKAVLKNSKTGAVIEEVLMAPGESGYFNGTVEATASAPVVFALTTEAASAPTTPDYDNGNFDWPSYADNMGITCYVGDQGYEKLSDAVAAAKSGQTVVMIGDATLTSTVEIANTVKIQCNGNTISLADNFAGDSAFSIAAGGALNWTSGMNINTGSKTALAVNGGSLNISGGSITGQTGVLVTSGNLIVTGGSITATENAIHLQQNINKSATTVTVTGGTITGANAFLHTNTTATPSENLTVSISGATLTGAVETREPHFVIQQNDGVYTLHGHILVIDEAVDPTCTETGLTQGVHYGCCEGTVVTPQTEVPALGHSWTEATCSASKVCNICGVSDGAPAEHPYTTKVTKPTCTTEGYTTYTCPDCGHSYDGDFVPANGHTPGAAQTENNVPNTCTTDGSYDSVTYCTVCTVQISRNTVPVPATGHTSGEIVVENVVDTTCTSDGSYDNVTYCTVCQAEATRETITTPAPEGGHNNDGYLKETITAGDCTTSSTYTEVFFCTACEFEHSRKTVETAAPGHKYIVGETNITCENCDYNKAIGTASITFQTGTKTDADVDGTIWKPTMTVGMRPAYAKTTAEGVVTTTGASASDWNVKLEWNIGGNPTLTLKNATIINELREVSYRTLVIGGSADWDIILEGTNAIYGNPTGSISDWHGCESIRATTTGMLTIKGNSTADSLKIENTAGNCITRVYGPLTIENATVQLNNKQNSSNGYPCLVMQYGAAGYEDVTNLTVPNASLTMYGPNYNSRAIVMAGETTAYTTANTGDILFQNSTINITRGGDYGWQTSAAVILNGPGSFVIDNCEATLNGGAYLFRYAPSIINCSSAKLAGYSIAEADYALTAGAAIDARYTKITTTHTCTHTEPVVETTVYSECNIIAETVTYCTFCGERTVIDAEDVSTKAHTIGSKVELVDQRVNAVDSSTYGKLGLESYLNANNETRLRVRTGKYVFQCTCSICGETWTEEEEFRPAIFSYLTSGGEDTATAAGEYDFGTQWADNTKTSYKPTTAIGPGQTKYFTTTASNATFTSNYYVAPLTDEAKIAAGEWNIKIEYPLYGTPVMTLKNAKVINGYGLWYGIYAYKQCAPLTIVLEGENIISNPDGMSYTKVGLLNLRTLNPVTITGTGSLNMVSRGQGGVIRALGDLTIDGVNIDIYKHRASSSYQDFISAGAQSKDSFTGGNLVIKDATIHAVGFGNVGSCITRGLFAAKNATSGKGGNLSIINSDVTIAGTFEGSAYGGIHAMGDMLLSNSKIVSAHGYATKADGSSGYTTRYGSAIVCGGTLTWDYPNGFVAHYPNSYTKHDVSVDPYTTTYPTFASATTTSDPAMLVVGNYNNYYFDITPSIELVKFSGSRIGVEDDLILEFALDASKVANTGYAMITRGRVNPDGSITYDEPIRVELSALTLDAGYYVIPYAGIAAKEMHDTVTVVVYNADGKVVTESRTDSVYDYALRMLRGTAPAGYTDMQFAKLKTVLVDLLSYGAMAQVQFEHNSENLVNKVLNPTEWTYTTAESTYAPKAATVTGTGYMGTAFELNSNIAMLMGIRTTELGQGSYAMVYVGDSTEGIRVDAEDMENNIAVFTFNGLVAAKGRTDVTWKFYKAGENAETAAPTLVVTDSLVSYVGRMIEDYPYLENLMKYCDAAAAFFEATQN